MSAHHHLPYAEGGITAPLGFLASGVAGGLKESGRKDLCLLVSESEASAAAVFTTNRMAAAPIALTRSHVADGTLRAVVVNSGSANACTGARGEADALRMAEVSAQALGVEPDQIAVASTGVIGVPVPMERVEAAIALAASDLDVNHGWAAAEAITTTDTFAKETAVTVEADGVRYTVGGMAKGSGMIRPDMATMLAFLTTDAPLTARACDTALRDAVAGSFARITVDGQTSTNDVCLLMANGAAGGAQVEPDDVRLPAIADAVAIVCEELARMIVRDGEGATVFIEVRIEGAANEAQAQTAAMAVADSALFKCAMYGRDPNWGRVVSAVGASGVEIDPARVAVRFAGVTVAEDGAAVAFDEREVVESMRGPEVAVAVDLGVGDAVGFAWTCDLSLDYVRINAEYRT